MTNDQFRQLTRRILATYRTASPEAIASGLDWYSTAYSQVEAIAARHGHVKLTRPVVMLAHLSPRVKWADNLRLLDLALAGAPKPAAALTRMWDKAQLALYAEDPLATFGPRARKTRSFARAILGDANAVVVDVWSTRVTGLHPDVARTAEGYAAITNAYRSAGRRICIPPREVQAVTWVALRGQHN